MKAEQLLSAAFIEEHPEEVAAILESAPARDAAEVLAGCPVPAAAAVLDKMDPPAATTCLLACPSEFVARLLAALSPESASRLLRAMEPLDRQGVLDLVGPPLADTLQRVLRYPDGTAGALMDPSVFPLPEGISAREAQRRIRLGSRHARNYAYVSDPSQALSGVVHLRDLILARPDQRLTEVMRPDVERVTAAAPATAVAGHPAMRRFGTLPVVDESNRVVGVLKRGALEPARAAAAPRAGGANMSIGLAQLVWTMGAAVLDQLFADAGASSLQPQSREEA